MKKALVIVLLYCTTAFGAATEISLTKPCESVSSDTNLVECNYIITNVDNDTTVEFKLETETTYGHIDEFILSTSSEDYSFWFSKDNGKTATDVDTFVYETGVEYSYRPDWNRARGWINRDGEQALYLTINNTAGSIATGATSKLSVTMGK